MIFHDHQSIYDSNSSSQYPDVLREKKILQQLGIEFSEINVSSRNHNEPVN